MTARTPLGRVLRDEDGVVLQFERRYDASPGDVWAALTDPDRLSRWFGTWSGEVATGQVDLVMTAEADAEPQAVGIIECDEPHRLVVDLAAPDGTWRLEVVLAAAADATVLVFRQRLAEPSDAGSIGPGWHFYLDRLGATLAGEPVPEDWDGEYYPALRDAYAVPD